LCVGRSAICSSQNKGNPNHTYVTSSKLVKYSSLSLFRDPFFVDSLPFLLHNTNNLAYVLIDRFVCKF